IGQEPPEQPELRRRLRHRPSVRSGRVPRRVDPQSHAREPLLGAASAQERVQTRDQLREGERLRQVVVAPHAESGEALDERVASDTATAPPTIAAPASAARKPQGTASRSGGGSKTCCSIATSISARSHPSRVASASAAPSTSAASLQTKAATDRSEAPSAAIVASSWRR